VKFLSLQFTPFLSIYTPQVLTYDFKEKYKGRRPLCKPRCYKTG